MATKIKGHRIEDGSIELKHFDPLIQIPESKLALNYPTHSNAGDLTVSQKNTMTLGGNADHLHYHTGGGGGPQGIYTNEERDAQLLKLSMLVNADVFGLDKALVENFNDDSGIYRGYPSAKSPLLESMTDNASYPGSLQQQKEYTYGVSYKNRYGQTSVYNAASCMTGTGFTNAMRIQLDDVPIDNQGLSIYRTEGSTEMNLLDEKEDKWENPFGMLQESYTSDKTSGFSAMSFTHENSVNAPVEYVTEGLPTVSGKGIALNATPNQEVPFDYFLIASSRTSAYSLEILWDVIPSYAPRDYEVYYTKDTQVIDFENANWIKFDKLIPHSAEYKAPACFATNGTVEGSYRVVNNTTPENKFYINPVEGITYLRIRVTRIDNLCRLRKVNLVGAERSHNRHFYLDTSSIDFTPFNTIKFDYKTTGHQIPFQVEAKRTGESVSSTTKLHNFAHGNMGSAHPEVRDGYIIARSYYSSTVAAANYNRVRIGIRIPANVDFRAENFYLRLADNSGSYNTPGSGNSPFYNIPITFNGKPYIECFETSNTDIWSDWMYLPKSSFTVYYAELMFKSIRGWMYYYNSSGWTGYSTSTSYIGKEDKSSFNFNSSGSTSRALYILEFGKTNSVSKNLSNSFLHSVWHKGYMDISSVNAIDYLKFFTGSAAVNTGTLVLDNFTVTKNKNLLGPTVSSTYNITSGGTVTNVTSDEYGLSTSKQIYFNQYATSDNPQIVGFKFSQPQAINQINFTCLTSSKTPSNYVLQYATSDSASDNAPLDSMDWIDFSNMLIGEPSFDVGFTGTVKGGRVIANNICNRVLAHRFDAVEVTKVRIWIEGTITGALPLIDNLEIYSAVDSQEMKLIYDTSSPATSPRFIMVDDGLKEQEQTTPRYNTTGSYNVIWNKDKKMVEVIDKGYGAVVYTNIIPTTLFQDFMLCAQYIGNVKFEVSFDDGESFVEVSLEQVHQLNTQSDSVVIKASLDDEASLHALAMLYTL